jgi:hypothetical protein
MEKPAVTHIVWHSYIEMFSHKLLVCFLFFLSFSFATAQTQDSTDVIQNKEITDTNTLIINDENLIFEAENIITDTATADTTSVNKKKGHSPKKAAWMSAAIPGLGQIYNKKYWKLPVVYGVLGGLSFGIYHNYVNYAVYRDEYRNRLNERVDLYNPKYADISTENINALKQQYQRNMELFIIFTAVGYIFNIIDAAVDAHLKGFNVSNDLSWHILPSIGLNNNLLTSYQNITPTINLTFTLNFK